MVNNVIGVVNYVIEARSSLRNFMIADIRRFLTWLSRIRLCAWPGAAPPESSTRDTVGMVEDTARDRAIYQALKASDEIAAALQTHLIEEHGAEPERAAAQSPSTNSLKLLRQARERLGQGLRAIEADNIAESDKISLRNQ
jgi:hypothetical protein